MEITIRQCRLRLVRRGGWTWGAEPSRIVDAATRALPRLLARHLAVLWPDDTTGEIAQPVRIVVPPVRLEEVRAIGEVLERDESEWSDADRAVVARFDELLATALAPLAERLQPQRTPPGGLRDPVEPARQLRDPDSGRRLHPVLDAMVTWHRRGELATILSRFTHDALELWERALMAPPASELHTTSQPADTVDRITAIVAHETDEQPLRDDDRRDAATTRTIARMLAAVRVYAELGLLPSLPDVRRALDQHLPHVPPPTTRLRTTRDAPADAETAPIRHADTRAAVTRPEIMLPQVIETTCLALPFLLIGPLRAIGWLDALRASCAARGFDATAAAATALACKVLPPPERGWRRQPAAERACAALAGTTMLDEAALVDLSRRAAEVLGPCDAVLAHAVIAAHTRDEPYVLVHSSGDLLLADAQGLFPVAVTERIDELPELASPATLLVAASAASPQLLARIADAGYGFITDAISTRGERWRLLQGAPGERYCAHEPRLKDPIVAGRLLTWAAGELEQLWAALVTERPAVPRDPIGALDRSVALAAAVALGYIAWTLWRHRETPHPRLALQRFADLEASIRIDARAVSVRLPLGQRHHDLLSHGLLEDVPDVPWLDGRPLRLTGG